jgi:hypothetical protein
MDWLVNYINHIVDFNNSYNKAIRDLCSKSDSDNITKSEEIIEYEKEIKSSYDTAMNLYNDLRCIADKYRSQMNIDSDLQWFHNRLIVTRLPIYENITLAIKHETDSDIDIGVPTGWAADINDLSYTNDDTSQEETPTVLHGGVRYCQYINEAENFQDSDNVCNVSDEDNTYFYSENKEDENQGYTGDSIELAAEYKKKYDEEQKKKAEQFAKQRAVANTNQNWILPVNGKITSGYGPRKPPVPGASSFHNGWDIKADIGTPIKAIASGKIIAAGTAKGYGKWVVIGHGRINGVRVTSEYGHISECCVSYGQFVKKGQIIAKSGNAGISSGPHLHITIREGEKFQGKDVSPDKYIKANF